MTVQTKPHIGRKIIATLIDYGLTILIFSVYVRQFGEYDSIDNSYNVHGFKSLPILAYWFIYHIMIEFLVGNTFGHFIADLKITNMAGEKTKIIQNIKRHLLDFFDLFMFGIPAILSINNSDKNQRLGDLWAKTLVVSSKDKIFKDFSTRPIEEQEWLMENTWCNNCKKADLGLYKPIEYNLDGKSFLQGSCKSCGDPVKSEIINKTIKTNGNKL